MRPSDLESLLPGDHRARIVWAFVAKLDLTEFHARIASREGSAGRPAFDPAVLLTLWIHATLEAVGSARALARNCGLRNFLVRGVPKCLAVLTLCALAHDVMRATGLLGTTT